VRSEFRPVEPDDLEHTIGIEDRQLEPGDYCVNGPRLGCGSDVDGACFRFSESIDLWNERAAALLIPLTLTRCESVDGEQPTH
jgi:hypothetical protein